MIRGVSLHEGTRVGRKEDEGKIRKNLGWSRESEAEEGRKPPFQLYILELDAQTRRKKETSLEVKW